jgi:hypothetical protein
VYLACEFFTEGVQVVEVPAADVVRKRGTQTCNEYLHDISFVLELFFDPLSQVFEQRLRNAVFVQI